MNFATNNKPKTEVNHLDNFEKGIELMETYTDEILSLWAKQNTISFHQFVSGLGQLSDVQVNQLKENYNLEKPKPLVFEPSRDGTILLQYKPQGSSTFKTLHYHLTDAPKEKFVSVDGLDKKQLIEVMKKDKQVNFKEVSPEKWQEMVLSDDDVFEKMGPNSVVSIEGKDNAIELFSKAKVSHSNNNRIEGPAQQIQIEMLKKSYYNTIGKNYISDKKELKNNMQKLNKYVKTKVKSETKEAYVSYMSIVFKSTQQQKLFFDKQARRVEQTLDQTKVIGFGQER